MSLKRKQFFRIIIVIKNIKNTTDQMLSNIKKNKFTEDIVAVVVTADEYGHRQTLTGLASVLGQR
jgi:phosphopentomutase